MMKKNNLDKKFTHSCWWKGSNLTRRQVIEWAASTKASPNGIYLLKKQSVIPNDNLFDPIEYKDYYVLKSDERGSYRLSEEEYFYYNERKSFWDKWTDEEKPEYSDSIYEQYYKMVHDEMM